jgi:2-polyprenyl-6-methoxyphenol hydroxylase-like FAD-dependent oxidoreductase
VPLLERGSPLSAREPGGLTLARLLQQSGAQVSVYERDQSRSARVQGSALDLHENSVLAALETAGLIDAFWANHRAGS